MLTTRGLGVVLADLSSLGFDAKWGVVSAADVGANHQRERIWIRAEQRNFFSHTNHNRVGRGQQWSKSTSETIGAMANTNSIGRRRRNELEQSQRHTSRQSIGISSKAVFRQMAYSDSTHGKGDKCAKRVLKERAINGKFSWWDAEPNVGRVADGVAARVDRLKAIGNGQVPLCAATAWELLK